MIILFVDLGHHNGGAETYVKQLAEFCNTNNIGYYLCVRKNSLFEKDLFNSTLPLERVISVEFTLKSIYRVKRLICDKGIQIIHANGINSDIFTLMISKKVIRIATVHGDADADRIERSSIVRILFPALERLCLSKFDKVISVSESLKQILIKRGIIEQKISVVYNGINPQCSDVLERHKKDGSFYICFVGRLEKVKGCKDLISGIHELVNKGVINIKCDIYGDGSEKLLLTELCESYGLNDYITFKGYIQNVRAIIGYYDALIQPSLYESFGITLLEAMWVKTLVICTNVGGMREIVKDEISGILFSQGDIFELTEKIVWAMEHPIEILAIETQAYELVECNFILDRMIESTFALYNSFIM